MNKGGSVVKRSRKLVLALSVFCAFCGAHVQYVCVYVYVRTYVHQDVVVGLNRKELGWHVTVCIATVYH